MKSGLLFTCLVQYFTLNNIGLDPDQQRLAEAEEEIKKSLKEWIEVDTAPRTSQVVPHPSTERARQA